MVERIIIEQALDKLASDEAGFKFQRLAVVLAKIRWPEFKLNACELHNDLGLDAYAPSSSTPNHRGVGVASSITDTITKIKGDARKVRKNYPDISLLIFYTSEKVTQEKKSEWEKVILEEFGLELITISREDIVSDLQIPANSQLCRTHLDIQIPFQLDIADLLGRTREAAKAVAADWATHLRLNGQPQIPLSAIPITERGGDIPESIPSAQLRALLALGHRLILEAPAGAGKTTTLVQLAQAEASDNGIPFLIDLPNLVTSSSPSDILQYLASSPAFRSRGVDAVALARLSQDTTFLFLLNGWNEIAKLYSQAAEQALREIDRAFPRAGIMVATRAHRFVPPLPGSTRFQLLPLTADQRRQFLSLALGSDQGREVNATVTGVRALDSLTRIPFFLSAVAQLVLSGTELPHTKLALITALVELIEHDDHHRNQLADEPLRGHARDYLRAIASYLTPRGSVLLPEAEAMSVCRSVVDDLRNAAQIVGTPEPADIIAALTAHHLLVRSDYPATSFRFQHQQFQEYYSALLLRGSLGDLAALRNYINDPPWEESLRMIAEDAGSSDAGLLLAKVIVQTALPIDPVFASRLAHAGGPRLWPHIQADVSARLRSLYSAQNEHYKRLALAAMLATGSEAFTDILIPLLTHPDQQVRLRTYRSGPEFHAACLGSDWRRVVGAWTDEYRAEFVSELGTYYGQLNVALAFAQSDPSMTVRFDAIRTLVWMGQTSEAVDLLLSLDAPEFQQIIQKLYNEEIPNPLRSRALTSYQNLLTTTTEPKRRMQISIALAELGDSATATRFKQELDSLSVEQIQTIGEHSLQPAIESVRKADPSWLSEWITDRILRGLRWRDTSMILGLPSALSENLLHRVSNEDLRNTGTNGVITVLKAGADPTITNAVLIALRNQSRALHADPLNEAKRAINAQLRGLLHAISPLLVVQGLSGILAGEPQSEDLKIITDLFKPTGVANDIRDPLPEQQRQELRAYLKAAVPVVIAQDDFNGEAKGHLASAIGEIGYPEDLQDVVRLIRADITRIQEGRAAEVAEAESTRAGRAPSRHSPQAQGSRMSWSVWHVEAAVRLAYTNSEAILLDLLNEPEYEFPAACGLQVVARDSRPVRYAVRAAYGGPILPDYDKLTSPAARLDLGFSEERRSKYAAAIRQRILAVREEARTAGDAETAYAIRLKNLSKVLAVLDPHASSDLILDIAELPTPRVNDGWSRVALLERLIFAGATLPTDRVLAIIEPIVEYFRAHGIHNQADLLSHVLSVLPFVDEPARGVARVREVMAEFRFTVYGRREVLAALSRCPDVAGLTLLLDIARENTGAFQHFSRDWIEAVASSPLPAAARILLGFFDPEASQDVAGLMPSDYDFLAARVVDRLRDDPVIVQRFIELVTLPLTQQQRGVLSKIVPWLDSGNALLASLSLIDDASPQPIPFDLRRAIEQVFLEKQPYRGDSQSYVLVPRAVADIKERLFDMVQNDPQRARSACRLLGQIEEWRLEYGRPAFEPRRPSIASGEPWPPAPPADQ